jgi:surface polysaccharide O-acyltransferase-like enzyme
MEKLRRRLERLLVPFVLWSLLYVGLRFFKANAFGYVDALRAELSGLTSWVNYALLGSAQYHLHFLPFLAGLTILYPLFRLAGRYLRTASLVLVTGLTAWYLIDAHLYALNFSPTSRIYLLRVTKTIGYLGFGALGFACYEAMNQGRLEGRRWRWFIGALAIVIFSAMPVLLHSFREAAQGRWLPLTFWAHLGRHLLVAGTFVILMVSDKFPWPSWIGRLGALTFGVYLVHPFVLDLMEVAERNVQWSPGTRCVVNLVIVTLVSFGVVTYMARVPALRWAIGLDRSYRR